MSRLIRGGRVVTATDAFDADVLIEGESIVAIGTGLSADEEIDASGCLVLPGLVDNHTHLSMPFGGTTTADDYDTGTQAAAAGGTTCLVDFALQMEPGGLRSSLEQWMGRAEGAAHVDYGFHMAITKADAGTFKDMSAMVDAGVYEIPDDAPESGPVDVTVNYTNCVQCGAITAKGGRLTPPEGGDGPLYQIT